MYDVAIIGGGPAGSTLARLIGHKYKVLLLEKRSFREPLYGSTQKCCGGLLDPDAQRMLATLGLGLPKTVIVSPQMFTVRTIDFDNSIERYYQRHYVNIDREEFDRWLESLIPTGVDRINDCIYRSHEETSDYIRIRYTVNGVNHEAFTRLLVGADGAHSRVRLLSFRNEPFPRRYFAIQEWLENTQGINYYGAVFDREITDFYSWTIPKESHIILGAALRPKDEPHRRFERLKEKLTEYGFEFGATLRKNGAFIARPGSNREIQTGRGRVALIGESAGFISPSSAEGISYAFRSALALATALSSDYDNWLREYIHNTHDLRMNITFKRLKSPLMYNPALRLLVMKSGLKSMSVKKDCPD